MKLFIKFDLQYSFMKFYLFPLVLLFTILSCSSSKDNDLIGVWKLKSIDVEQAIRLFKGDQKDFARKMINQAYDKYKDKLTLSFEEDGTYTIATPLINGKVQTEIGKWRINSDKTKLFIQIQNQEEETIRVLKLSKNKLVIEVNNDGVGVMNMIYSKE